MADPEPAPSVQDESDDERRIRAAEAERDRWKQRGLDAERRYREREVALRRLRADLEELRADRDLWREQADRLTSALAQRPDPHRNDRLDAAAGRTEAIFRAAWSHVPEPGRKIARPLVRRVRSRVVPPAPPPPILPPVAPMSPAPALEPEPAGSPAPRTAEPAETGRTATVAQRVSVLIPTLNAGPELARTLDAIASQEGVGTVELLVVDSGSTDGTPQLARERGATVVEIPPEEFSHGRTRDRMAEMATGDVLVMTVQDAVLAGPHALRDLVLHLDGDPIVAAVSARQIPRLDCDLFGAFIMFAHYRATVMRAGADGPAWFPMLTLAERRACCAVDNVCAAIRRTAWEALRYRDVPFGEDLDFGLRAVEQGWRVATAPDVAVIHSHHRDARYHLARFLVDRLTVAALLGDPDTSPAAVAGLEGVAAAGVELLREVEGACAAAAGEPGFVEFGPYVALVAGSLEGGAAGREPTGELAGLLGLLEGCEGPADPAVTDYLRDGLRNLLRDPLLKEFGDLHTHVEQREAESFVGKATALVLGAVLGDSMRDTVPDGPLARRLRGRI